MAKKVNFGKVSDLDKQGATSDVRMNMEDVADPVQQEEGDETETTEPTSDDALEQEGTESSENVGDSALPDADDASSDTEEAPPAQAVALSGVKPESAHEKRQKALEQVAELTQFFDKHTEDSLHKSFKVNRIHIHQIKEVAERVASKKAYSLSPGTCDTIGLVHARLKKAGKI